MEIQEELNKCLEEVQWSRETDYRSNHLNRVLDILESNTLEITFLEGFTDNLIDLITMETDIKVRSKMFNVVEKALMVNRAIDPDLDRLVIYFDESDPTLIGYTLRLIPLNGKKGQTELVEKYLDHPDDFIRKNAEYARKYIK